VVVKSEEEIGKLSLDGNLLDTLLLVPTILAGGTNIRPER
jgi:hypothetical protein